jgi:D-alanyl-D-alanine carboxypeptidase-like protein
VSFYTDVIVRDARFRSVAVIRDPALLEPSFRASIMAVIQDAGKEGTMLRILETYRSQALQELYFERGATQLRTVGCHHFGVACDLGIVLAGQINWKADYSILGKLAAKHGLVWGGDWGDPKDPHSFRDYDHLQLVEVKDQTRLFAGTWYPPADYRPTMVG